MTKFFRIPHVVLCAAVGLSLGSLVLLTNNEYYLRILFLIGVYYICALGVNVLVGFAGQKSLGQAGLFAAGAYAFALLTNSTSINPWLAVVLAVVISAVFGLLIALPSLRVQGPYLAMVTLAFGIVVEKVVTEWTDVFGGAQGLFGIRSLTVFGSPLSTQQLVLLVIVLGVFLHWALRNLLLGRYGRAWRSLQTDEIASASMGINVYRFKILAFVIAAAACGLGGALVAVQTLYINSDFINVHLSIFILLLVLVGGGGSIYGPLWGAIFLVLIDALLTRWPAVQHLVYGALLLFALYVMPKGFAGLKKRVPVETEVSTSALNNNVDLEKIVSVDRKAGGEPIVRIAGLTKSFGGVMPAKNVGFDIQKMHVLALIGPNGAGKSTTVNMITGVVRPDEGSIVFENLDITNTSPALICEAGVARTFQNLRLFKDLSVLENVMVGAHCRMNNGLFSSLFNLSSAQREEVIVKSRAMKILDALGLSDHATSIAGDLPYGLQRRVELARALATEPKLLLLDEPAAGLNPSETAELGGVIQQIARSGITVLMVEHHMDLVMSISDHVVVLDYGVKIAEGTPAEIQTNEAVIKAYLGEEDDDAAEHIGVDHHVGGMAYA